MTIEEINKNFNIETREEEDSLGKVNIPKNALYGTTTTRAHNNFKIGKELMPIEIIKTIALIKKCAAVVNCENKKISKEKCDAIGKAAEEIRIGHLDDEFILPVFQTGSGTATNMNVNEVICGFSKRDIGVELHPNDEVNMGQSTNDVFPSATQIAVVLKTNLKLLPVLEGIKESFLKLAEDNKNTIKIGRTHLQDAVPITLADEINSYAEMIERGIRFIKAALEELLILPLGGTAVGNGINTTKDFSRKVIGLINKETNLNFIEADNKFYGLSSKSNLVNFSGALTALSTDLLKISNDIRFLSSGPRAGYGELIIPKGEPGSSIMPGKVNPTQAESLTQVCADVFGSNQTIIFSASQGNFELNVYKPVIAYHLLRMIDLLSDAVSSFNNNLVIGIKPNIEKLAKNINETLVTATALTPKLGYDLASKISTDAYNNNTTIKDELIKLGKFTDEEIEEMIDIKNMIK